MLYKSNRFALVFFLAFLSASVLFSLLFTALFPDAPAFLTALPLYLICFGGAAFFFCKQEKIGRAQLGLGAVSGKTVLLSFLLGLLLQPGCMLISYLTELLFVNVEGGQISMMTSWPLPLLLLCSALLPAFFEELICRGIVLRGYTAAPLWALILFSALYFGTLHANFQQALYAAALGAVFAYMDFRAASILPSMISHFVLNACQLSLAWLVTRRPALFGGLFVLDSAAPNACELLIYAGAALLTLPLIILCIQGIRPRRPIKGAVPPDPAWSDFDKMWPMYAALLLGLVLMILQEIGL